MTSPAGVLIVTQEPQTAKAVADVISTSGDGAARTICRDLDDLLVVLERNRAPAVVVDIDPQPVRMLNELESIINRHAGTRFIVLSSEQRSDLMLQAMQAGVRHFMAKDKIKSDLLPALVRLTPTTTSRNGWHGSIVTVLSAGGGCGATTFAINLANELHLLVNSPTLLIDMDCHYGAASGYLGITAQYGVADVLADGDRIDAQLIRSTALSHNEHLHVLASPATVDLESPATPAYEHLGRALQKVRETYSFTVVDAPRASTELATKLATASVMTYIVLEMTVEHIRVARSMYAALASRGVQQDHILPLISRYRGRREMISMDDAQRAIGCARIGHLSNDYKGVLASINFGKLLADSSPRSGLRADIQVLARSLRSSAVGAVHAGAGA